MVDAVRNPETWDAPVPGTPTPTSASEPVASFDSLLESGVEGGLTGVALAVDQDGEVFDGATGLANDETQTPLSPTDRFRIYSITKTFTAVLVLQLVDEGVLTLEDTVSQWLDDPVVARIPNVDRITIRQLLTHTSGVYDYYNGADSLRGRCDHRGGGRLVEGVDAAGAARLRGRHAPRRRLRPGPRGELLRHRLHPAWPDCRAGQWSNLHRAAARQDSGPSASRTPSLPRPSRFPAGQSRGTTASGTS